MNPNLVSATLSTDDQQTIIAAVNTVLQKLPFLIDLTTDDRVAMAKLGDKTEAFVRKAVEIAQQHQPMFAAGFVEEMKKDADLLDALSPIRLAVDTLQKKIDDTAMQLGAEAYAAARTVYTVTKTPYANAVLRTAFDDLSQRYGRSKKAKATAAASSTTPALAPGNDPALKPTPDTSTTPQHGA
jgi:hypothetical protein